MEKIGRERRSEGAWREIVGRQAESGLTVQAFCEREGIKSASLYGWRSRWVAAFKTEACPGAHRERSGLRSLWKSSSIWAH